MQRISPKSKGSRIKHGNYKRYRLIGTDETDFDGDDYEYKGWKPYESLPYNEHDEHYRLWMHISKVYEHHCLAHAYIQSVSVEID